MPRTRKPRSSKPVKARAREIRHSLTLEEQILWLRLRNRQLGVKFRRQVPIGPFIVDFCCHEALLVIELDGKTHLEQDQAALDSARTEWLAEVGYRVLRFWNNEVRIDTEAVVARITRELPLSRSAGEGRGEGRSNSLILR
jgi:very-short-patch-repair endonuclease